MPIQLAKGFKKIVNELEKLNTFSKAIINYGTKTAFVILVIGSVLLLISTNFENSSALLKISSISLIKSSFSILAEVVVGGLVIDYVSK